MSTLSPEGSTTYRIASAFPGRIRLQMASGGSSRAARLEGAARVERLASSLAALAPVQSVEKTRDAGSVIVRYDAKAHSLEAMLARVHQATMQTLNMDLPAPIALFAPSSVADSVQRVRMRGRQQTNGRALKRMLQQIPGEHERITAYTLPPEKPRGLKSLIMPTLAVALSALEVLPLAIVGAALAIATLPIAQRAAKRRSKSILSVDILDTASIVLMALEGSFLPASVVAWLIALGELLRGETVLRSRRALLSAVHERAGSLRALTNGNPDPEYMGRLVAQWEHRTLSDTRLQDNALRSSRGLAWPATAAALLVFSLSRDLGDLIGIIKPGKDFSSATRFGLPTNLLNAITQGYRHNIEFESGRALEELARADAFVFRSAGADFHADTLPALVESLLNRGARHIVLPFGEEARSARARAEELGWANAIVILDETPVNDAGMEARLLDTLRAQGRKPALVQVLPPDRAGAAVMAQVTSHTGDRSQEPEQEEWQSGSKQPTGYEGQESQGWRVERAEEARFGGGDTEDAGELTLSNTPDTVTYIGPAGNLPIAIDLACQSAAVCEQSAAMAGTAALFNFVTNLLRVSPAPLSTLINTITLVLLSRNALRPLNARPAPDTSRLLILPPFRVENLSGQEADA